MLRQPGQNIEDVMGRARVEVAGRLVGDEQGRVVGQRPGDRDPLLLSAGDLRGETVSEVRRSDFLETGDCALAPGGATERFRSAQL